MAGIRRFRASDTDDLYEVCLGTGDSGEDATGMYDNPRLLGEVYVGPYLVHAPEFAWVYANEADRARGYVLGVADTSHFDDILAHAWWPVLQATHPRAPEARNPLDREVITALHHPQRRSDGLLREYPSHLHIDMLPDVRGGGRGGAMLNTVLRALAEAGSPGVHLGVAPDNANAIGFYRHIGFSEAPEHSGPTELVMTKPL